MAAAVVGSGSHLATISRENEARLKEQENKAHEEIFRKASIALKAAAESLGKSDSASLNPAQGASSISITELPSRSISLGTGLDAAAKKDKFNDVKQNRNPSAAAGAARAAAAKAAILYLAKSKSPSEESASIEKKEKKA